jgi:hypothetical protein
MKQTPSQVQRMRRQMRVVLIIYIVLFGVTQAVFHNAHALAQGAMLSIGFLTLWVGLYTTRKPDGR